MGVHRAGWKIRRRMAKGVDSTKPSFLLLAKLMVKTGIRARLPTDGRLATGDGADR